MTHSQIAALTQEKSRSPPRKQDLPSTEPAARETEQEQTHRSSDYRHPHDTSGVTFGGLTWAQRMGAWRKSAYKKKDEFTYEYKYRWTNWPICERWKSEPSYKESCSIMSQQYFGCDFDWDMAVEADRLGFRHEQQERKGKGYGKFGEQTFIV